MPLPYGSYGLKGLQSLFTEQMYSFVSTITDQGFALVCINDILLFSHNKAHMLDNIDQLHRICSSNRLENAPEYHFIFSPLSDFLDMKLAKTQKTIFSKTYAIHKYKNPTSKPEIFRFFGSVNSYSKSMNKLSNKQHVHSIPFTLFSMMIFHLKVLLN